jgi:hypothetical protein
LSLLDFSLFPPVLILFDHPIGVVGLSIEHRFWEAQNPRRPGECKAPALIVTKGLGHCA